MHSDLLPGRSDDIIKSREKVSSVELENVLYDIPAVHPAAVMAVPDETLGQTVRPYVVLDEKSGLTTAEIRRVCRSKLESFMVPRDVIVVDVLPHTWEGEEEPRGGGCGIAAARGGTRPGVARYFRISRQRKRRVGTSPNSPLPGGHCLSTGRFDTN